MPSAELPYLNKSKPECPPVVSIGMPVYNGEKYIREALESLLNQTFRNFELTISDNASTDETEKICKEYASRDKRIRYIRQLDNLGPVANFLLVFSEARGTYFMWAAHDDRWGDTFIERLVAVLESDKGCGLAFSNYIVRNLDTGEEVRHKVAASDSRSAIRNYIIRTFNMRPSLIYGMYRIALVKTAILSTPFDFADVHFISDLAIRTKILVVEDFLYVAGTKGVRKPYSVTHRKINRMTFLKKQGDLLLCNFSLPVAIFLFFIVCSVMAYNKLRLWRY